MVRWVIVLRKFILLVVDAEFELTHQGKGDYNKSLNSSMLNPASRTIPAIVNELTGLARGIVIIRVPLVIVICLPWLAIQNPAFLKPLTAPR